MQVRGDHRRPALALVRGEQPRGPRLSAAPGAPPAASSHRPATCKTTTGTPPAPGTTPHAGYRAHALWAAIKRPRLPAHRIVYPEGHRAFEHVAPHSELGVLLTQPGQLGPLILAQRPVPLTAAAPVSFTQFPRVPSLIPRSRATCAIGLPVSRTSRTAPSLKSASNFLRALPSPSPLRGCLHARRGNPRARDHRIVDTSVRLAGGPVALDGLVMATNGAAGSGAS